MIALTQSKFQFFFPFPTNFPSSKQKTTEPRSKAAKFTEKTHLRQRRDALLRSQPKPTCVFALDISRDVSRERTKPERRRSVDDFERPTSLIGYLD